MSEKFEKGMSPEGVLGEAERVLDEKEKEELIQAMQNDDDGPRHGKVNFMVRKLIEKSADRELARQYLGQYIEAASKGSSENLVRDPRNGGTLYVKSEGIISVAEDGTETII